MLLSNDQRKGRGVGGKYRRTPLTYVIYEVSRGGPVVALLQRQKIEQVRPRLRHRLGEELGEFVKELRSHIVHVAYVHAPPGVVQNRVRMGNVLYRVRTLLAEQDGRQQVELQTNKIYS